MAKTVQLESITRHIEYRDPVLLYHHLMGGRRGGLLLESAEVDSKRHLNSYLLVKAALQIRCRGNRVTVSALTQNGLRLARSLAEHLGQERLPSPGPGSPQSPLAEFSVDFGPPDSNLDEDRRLQAPSVLTPLRALFDCVHINSTVHEALFAGGLFGYDLVECFEPIPPVSDPGRCPNYVFNVAEQLVHLDHVAESAQLIGSFFYQTPGPDARAGVERELDAVVHQCQHLRIVDLPPCRPARGESRVDKTDSEFEAMVRQLQQKILQGEVFQIVPSRAFSSDCPDPLRAYRQLRQLNPSPYMFYMSDESFTLFGASPEMAVRFTAADRQVEVCPIAGTRHRGKNPNGSLNPDLDSRIELELRTDAKEMAEHLMLVDLARNDLARICEPGTRHVAQLLKVDRYSHVMHLVSRVAGTLRAGLDALHAWQSCMNMGTLTGAPKVRAMQLIRELEGVRRDSYGGGIGYLLGNGDMETCIVIRSALVVEGTARVQAGAGIVYDSIPQSEAEETRNKAAAVLAALQTAHES